MTTTRLLLLLLPGEVDALVEGHEMERRTREVHLRGGGVRVGKWGNEQEHHALLEVQIEG